MQSDWIISIDGLLQPANQIDPNRDELALSKFKPCRSFKRLFGTIGQTTTTNLDRAPNLSLLAQDKKNYAASRATTTRRLRQWTSTCRIGSPKRRPPPPSPSCRGRTTTTRIGAISLVSAAIKALSRMDGQQKSDSKRLGNELATSLRNDNNERAR